MSGRIADEVLNHAPIDLTVAERITLVSLALSARDTDRTARYDCSYEDLARRTGLKGGTVRNALTELARRGLIRRLVSNVHRGQGGKHQEYELARLAAHHRFTTLERTGT